jgi:hypothetical protein
MAKIWGPMGWLTLHSIAAAYPDEPTQHDKNRTSNFLELFTDTITCRFCKDHFYRMHMLYRSQNPNYLDSKQNFFMFTLRAHNEVNRSLDKPIMRTVAESIQTLKGATSLTLPQVFKDSYMSYLIRTWAHEMTGDAFIYKSKAITMRDMFKDMDLTNVFDNTFEESDTTYKFIVVPKAPVPRFDVLFGSAKVGFSGGKLRLH